MLAQGFPFLSQALTVEFEDDSHHSLQLAYLDIVGRNIKLFQLKDLYLLTNLVGAPEKAFHLLIHRLLPSLEGAELVVEGMHHLAFNRFVYRALLPCDPLQVR